MELILFTTSFPLGSGEQFLEGEILYLSKNFSLITIIPLTDSGKPEPRNIPSNVVFLSPLLPVSLNDKIRLFLLGVFNRAPLLPFLKDFFNNKVFMRKSWLLHWLSAISVARTAISSCSYKKIKEIVTPSTLIYFYWGDKSSALSPFLKEKFVGVKLLARFHGTDLYETKTPGYMPFRNELIRKLDIAVFISEHGLRYFKDRYPSTNDMIKFVARLGVNDHGQGIPSGDGILRMVSCSNMVKIKRIHLIAEALVYVGIQVEWTHIGDGELFDELKALSLKMPHGIRVNFKGYMKNSELIQYYMTEPVDLFINTSIHEGLPVSIMEAISFGIPVIAPDAGGIPEIVNEDNGVLIPVDAKADEIASVILKFYNLPPAVKKTMRMAARQYWMDHFNADINYQEFCEKMKSLLYARS